MFNHPQILADIARERQHDLIAEAASHRQAVLAIHERQAARRSHRNEAQQRQHSAATAPHRSTGNHRRVAADRTGTEVRGAPEARNWSETDARSAGRLTGCEASREITAGQAR